MTSRDVVTFLPKLIYRQWSVNLPEPKESFEGQTVIVTGASNGLGLEAARLITSLKAEKVILAVRNIEKGEGAKKSIEESTGLKGVVEVWQLDLAKHQSVKDFAEKAKQLPRIDVLLLNAGISVLKFSMADGDEETMTVNVVSSFLLLALLIPKLKETAANFKVSPRVSVVTSELHAMTSLPERKDPSGSIFAALRDEKKARMGDRYNATKLIEVFAVRQLVEDHGRDYPVIINLVNPGLCRSGLIGNVIPRPIGLAMYTVLAARPTDVGSRTLVHAAGAGRESTGEYLADCKISPISNFVLTAEGKKTQKRVWEELEARLEEIEPGCTKNF